MSQYQVKEVTRREELDCIVDVIWAAMEGPDPSHPVFFPILSHGPTGVENAIQSSKDRLWEDHKGDTSSHWLFVRDMISGYILGGCQWRVYTGNPFPDGIPLVEALWWPEGEYRRFGNEVVKQLYTPRRKWMAYPHVGLSFMCVDPKFQRRGLGRLMMDYGLAKMDQLGLEGFIEATDSGKALYARCGFRPVSKVDVNMYRPEASAEWRYLVGRLLPIGYTAMWRPQGGIWRNGEPFNTWVERLQS